MTEFIEKDIFNNYNIIIETPRFKLDEKKNSINKSKHKISFNDLL